MMEIFDIYPKEKRILLVGGFPPPLGGVSVYASRLYHLLKKRGYNARYFNLSKKEYFRYQSCISLLIYLFFLQFDIVHLLSLDLKLFRLIFFVKKIKNISIYITDHNPRAFEINSIADIEFYKKCLTHVDYLVVVADHILHEYKKNTKDLPRNILIKNAFLPPPLEDETRILETYNKSVLSFIEHHKPVIVANAFQIEFCKNIDLYGLDMCIEVTSLLKKEYPDIGFIFALANEDKNSNYVILMKNRIKELGIENNFYFMTGQKDLWPIFKMADLMVRPTYTDGYGISIDEALYFGCPAIASDVCKRAEGTIYFKNRDITDLYDKCTELLAC